MTISLQAHSLSLCACHSEALRPCLPLGDGLPSPSRTPVTLMTSSELDHLPRPGHLPWCWGRAQILADTALPMTVGEGGEEEGGCKMQAPEAETCSQAQPAFHAPGWHSHLPWGLWAARVSSLRGLPGGCAPPGPSLGSPGRLVSGLSARFPTTPRGTAPLPIPAPTLLGSCGENFQERLKQCSHQDLIPAKAHL